MQQMKSYIWWWIDYYRVLTVLTPHQTTTATNGIPISSIHDLLFLSIFLHAFRLLKIAYKFSFGMNSADSKSYLYIFKFIIIGDTGTHCP